MSPSVKSVVVDEIDIPMESPENDLEEEEALQEEQTISQGSCDCACAERITRLEQTVREQALQIQRLNGFVDNYFQGNVHEDRVS